MYYPHSEISFEKIDSKTDRSVVVNGEKLMTVLVKIAQSSESEKILQHHHVHEQATYVVSGKVKFLVGIEKKEVIVEKGDFLSFLPNEPHGCISLSSSSTLLDMFTPVREDFL